MKGTHAWEARDLGGRKEQEKEAREGSRSGGEWKTPPTSNVSCVGLPH